MTNEEAIAFLEQYINSEVYTEKCISAHEMAITALRSAHAGDSIGYHFPDTTKMVPLTLEQLRWMRGKWVWIVSPDKELTVSGWAYVGKDHVFTYWEYEYDAIVGRVVYNLCDYGAWLAYAYPPAHIDREAWKGCVCNIEKKSCCTCISLQCNSCIGESKYKQGRYCSACGRPLTEAAWDELENRMGVMV